MSFFAKVNRAAAKRLPVKWVRANLDAPIASFSFDDFPRSAWSVGGPILARHGALATYYAAGSFCGSAVDGIDYFDRDDLVAIRDAGHEVGCHSFSHEHGPALETHVLTDDLERNDAFLADVLGQHRTASFAYPYGDVSPRTKLLAARAFPVGRGIRAGVNHGLIDLAELKAVPLEQRSWSAAEVEDWIAEAAANMGWIVFFSHDVAETPTPYGCTPAMLEHALETVRAAGIEILPVKSGLARAVFG
jgi:peptidoglycan/xylan/chitin deacetylase (PgdA/CDA1 family)